MSLIYFYFNVLCPHNVFCAAIRRDSVSFSRFPFLCHFQVISYEISLDCRLKYPYILVCCSLSCFISGRCNQSFFVLRDVLSMDWRLIITCYFTLLRVFPTSVNWWFSTGAWGTSSLLTSPGLFSVFWLIFKMLLFSLQISRRGHWHFVWR